MKRLYQFVAFSIFQLIQLAITILIILFIIYSLSGLMPVGGMRSEQGLGVVEPPTFQEWLYGSGDSLGIINGDFGVSFTRRQPVGEMLNQSLPVTLELIQLSLFYSFIIGVLLAIVLVLLRRYFTDGILSLPLMLAGSIPVFCLALVLILEFALKQQTYPMSGRCSITISDGCANFADRVPYLVLPVASLTIIYLSGIALYLRDAILRYSQQEGGKRLTLRQVIGGLFIFSPISLFGTLVGMVSSVALVETIFAYPGAGRLFVSALASRDVPVALAILVIASVGIAVVFAAAMLVYGLMLVIFPPRPPVADDVEPTIEPSPFRQRLRSLSRLTAIVAALVLVGIVVLAFTNSGDPAQTLLESRLLPPDAAHPWGTDTLGRDYQTRLMFGGQTVFTNAVIAGMVALVVTLILGVIGGLFGGAFGAFINLLLNIGLSVLQSFPAVLLLAFLSLIFLNSPTVIPVIIGVLTLPQTVPVMRSAIQAQRSGQSVPLLKVLLYILCVVMARAVLLGAMVDFLGFGVQPPTPTWGGELSNAIQALRNADYLIMPPVILLTVTIFCFTLIYVHLHDSFTFLVPGQSPKTKRKEKLFEDVQTEQHRDVLFADVN